MGEVYRASDSRLGREVALKVLPPDVADDLARLDRFEREARSLAALDHPGIVTVFSVEEAKGVHFLTMQLVPGRTLGQLIPDEGFPQDRLVELAIPLSGALAAAHEKQIVHRDLKPGNIMVTDEGRVKVLDFGLAKQADTTPSGSEDPTRAHGPTQRGAIVGTMPYMSPEQIEARDTGPPSDVFSLGIVLYEMATGRRPFQGDSAPALMSSILRETPLPPSRLRSSLSKGLDALIARCLEKDPARRISAKDLQEALLGLRDGAGSRRFLRPWIVVPLTLVVAGIVIAAWTTVNRSRRAALVAEAIPRIESLAQDTKYIEAFALAKEVERNGGANALTVPIRDSFSSTISVDSSPPGTTISIRPFGNQGTWTPLGPTPLHKVRVPRGPLHWRAELAGHLPSDFITATPDATIRFELRKNTVSDRDMVFVPAADVDLWSITGVKVVRRVPIGSFLIDRHEVTNEEFARFVNGGGYRREELWKHEFRDGARALSFREAMERFRDATGRPGPSNWRLGSFPDGEEQMPVSGVSWYEAAAFAQYAGKELPTVYHWYQADIAGDLQLLPGLILPMANYESAAPRRASSSRQQSAYGAIDMAGNMREWSATASDAGTRLILGGGWTDPSYMFLTPELVLPLDRSAGNGFRCIRRLSQDPLAEDATRAVTRKPVIDNLSRSPVGDEMYEVFTRFFDRVAVPLEPRVEATDESSRHWIKQKVSYAAGYDGERILAWLYLPRTARPPYQVMIQMAGTSTFMRSKSSAKESDIFGWSYAEYLLRGGRAVLIPIWKGSYERQDGFHPFESDRTVYRDHVIQWIVEMRQSVDYLESRKDIDASKIGYQGISFGSIWAPLFLALEPRLETGILLLGGLLVTQASRDPLPPELQALNYAPRVKVPVLMLSGRYDPIFPFETSQVPLFKLLGTPPDQKRHLTFPAGHTSYGWRDHLDREGLEWLDRQFGPVTPSGVARAAQ